MKPIAIFLRARGCEWLYIYIDHFLPMADTAAQAQSQLIFLLTNLGFIINVQKSITSPT